MNETDLAALLTRCLAKRDRSDWEEFIRLAQPSVRAGVLRTLSRFASLKGEAVEDLVQEAFLKMCAQDFRILRNFRSHDSKALHVYLKTIAASTAIDHVRIEKTQKKGSGKTGTSLTDAEPGLGVEDPQFSAFEYRSLLRHVEKCLEGQGSRNRNIFWLYHRQGLTPKVIAGLPGINVTMNAVETVIYRVTKAVRECLKTAGVLKPAEFYEGRRA